VLTLTYTDRWLNPNSSLLLLIFLLMVSIGCAVSLREWNAEEEFRVDQGQNRVWRSIIMLLIVSSPFYLGFASVLPWSQLGVPCVISIFLCFHWRKKTRRDSNFIPGTLAFGYLVSTTFIGLLALWPRLVCQGVYLPSFLSWAITRSDQILHSFPAFAHPTRDDGLAISVVGENARTLLLTDETLHLITIAFLLIGGWFASLAVHGRFRFFDFIKGVSVSLLTLLTFSILLWQSVRELDDGQELWRLNLLPVSIMVLLWLCSSYILDYANYSDLGAKSIRNRLHRYRFRIPRCKSFQSLSVLMFAASALVLTWQDPGIEKAGKILIDELHSEWELSNIPMDSEYFGVKTVYNYGYMSEILNRHFSTVEFSKKELTNELLDGCDVLILKTPTSPYTPDEVEAVRKFVHDGGGLWLIGDHTNIFGMNTYLNQIGKTWGITFNADAVKPLDGYYQHLLSVDVPPVHSCGQRTHEVVASKNYLNHPIVGVDIPYCLILTSCSVRSSFFSEHVTVSRGTYIDHAKFGPNTFFGDLEHGSTERYGCVLQNAALRTGEGRVATWSDSTLFSNFSMAMPGVSELCLGYATWLNHRNLLSGNCQLLLSVMIFGCGCLCWFVKRSDSDSILWAWLTSGLMFSCLIPVMNAFNVQSHPHPIPGSCFSTVGFDQQYSKMELPTNIHVHQNASDVFESFFTLVQRLHLMPRACDSFSDIVGNEINVVVDPVAEIAAIDEDRLKRWVHNGGVLLLMVSGNQLPDAIDNANGILTAMDADSRFSTLDNPLPTDLFEGLTHGEVIYDVMVSAKIETVSQDEIQVRSSNQDVILHCENFGKGAIILCSVAELFSNSSVGVPAKTPTPRQASRLRFAMSLLRYLVQKAGIQDSVEENGLSWEKYLRNLKAN
jgi:hypothetical protein